MPPPHFIDLAVTLLIAFVIRVALIGGGISLWTRVSDWARRRRIYQRALAPGQLVSELKSTVVTVAFDALVAAAVLTAGLVRFADQPSVWLSAGTFVAIFAWFEVWFYATHRLLHHPKLYFLHRQHHAARVTNPLSATSFSLVERFILQLGLLGFVALVSQWTPISRLGFGAYVFANYLLNVYAHTNVELLPAGFGRTLPGRLLFSSTFHAMHHARMLGHYGLFTQGMDRLFGTFFDDFAQVHARAASGDGLQKLGERCKETAATRSTSAAA